MTFIRESPMTGLMTVHIVFLEKVIYDPPYMH